MAQIHYKRNKHQKEFQNDIKSKRLHLSTGFGGGKTYALIMKMFKLSQLNRNVHGGFMCPTLVEFKKDVLPLVEEICDLNGIKFEYHKTENWFRFPWSKGKIFVVGAERKIRGPNWGFALINEVTLCPLIRYKEILGRVRVKKAKFPQVASVGTPEGMASEYYDYMIDNPREGFRIIYGDTRDNVQNLNEDYVTNLEDSYDEVMLDAYLRGLWVNMSGNRFYYAYRPEVNDDEKIKRNPMSTTHVALDFNVDNMTASLWNYDGRHIKAFDEIVLKKNADTVKMCDALKARDYHPEDCVIYPDPAGYARSTKGLPDIEILKREGFYNIKAKRKAPLMRQRQLNVNNLLSKGVIKLNPDKCKTLKKDLIGVEQDTVKFDKIKSNPLLTHASDGMDYLMDILFPFSGSRTNSRVERMR